MSTHLNLGTAFLGPYKQTAFSMNKIQILKGGRNTFKTTRHMTRIILESYLRPNLVSFAIGYQSDKLETGLMSEAEKIADRYGLTCGESGRGKFIVKDGDYCMSKKPREMRFANGSVIHFDGSKNMKALKGRAIKGDTKLFGFILFDEWADYEEKDAATLNLIINTFQRTDTRQDILEDHFMWKDRLDLLDLDTYETDPETGKIRQFVNEYGEVETATIKGRHTLGCKFLFSYNPPQHRESWVYQWEERYCNRTDTMTMHINYTDIIDELVTIGQHNIIAEAEETKRYSIAEYMHTWLGQPTSIDGLYFHSFQPDDCVVDTIPTEYEDLVIAVDFGTVNPTTFVAIGYYDYNFYIVDAYYHTNKKTNVTKAPSDYATDLILFADHVKKKHKVQGQVKVFYDPSAKGFKDEVEKLTKRNRHCPIKMRKANNDRKTGLTLMFQVITKGNFKYPRGLSGRMEMEMEIRKAECSKNGDDIVKMDDHFIDAIRYGLMGFRKTLKRQVVEYFIGGENE